MRHSLQADTVFLWCYSLFVAAALHNMDDLNALLNQFVKMGTTDHDELVSQFTTILPNVDPNIARFFLEANGWSLQDSIASYFDNAGEDTRRQIRALSRPKPQMAFAMRDDGDVRYAPGQRFTKAWMFKNTGNEVWPQGIYLVHTDGERMNGPTSLPVPQLAPNETAPLTLEFTAPPQQGQYYGTWQLQLNDSGIISNFGDPLWVMITVEGEPVQSGFGWGFGQPQQSHTQQGFHQVMDMSEMRAAMAEMEEDIEMDY